MAVARWCQPGMAVARWYQPRMAVIVKTVESVACRVWVCGCVPVDKENGWGKYSILIGGDLG